MALKCLVKISSVNNLSDARYTAGMGVELMGFDLNPASSNFVSPEQFHAITSWISGVQLVGEFNDHYLAVDLGEVLSQYHLDYVQVSHRVAPAALMTCPLPIIVNIDVDDKTVIANTFKAFQPQPAWFLVEPFQSISSELLQWCIEMADQYPIILGTNISLDNLNEVANSGFGGLALRGGQEIRPGYKDFDELADILEALETDD